MHLKSYFYLLLTIATIIFACKDKDSNDKPCSYYGSELQYLEDAYNEAGDNYFVYQTLHSCGVYKSALQAYLNALVPYGDCETLSNEQRNIWQNDMDEVQQKLNNIGC